MFSAPKDIVSPGFVVKYVSKISFGEFVFSKPGFTILLLRNKRRVLEKSALLVTYTQIQLLNQSAKTLTLNFTISAFCDCPKFRGLANSD